MPIAIQEIDFSELFSSTDRLLLAQALLDDLMVDQQADLFTAEQLAELDRRVTAIDSGAMPFESWEMLRERLLLHR